MRTTMDHFNSKRFSWSIAVKSPNCHRTSQDTFLLPMGQQTGRSIWITQWKIQMPARKRQRALRPQRETSGEVQILTVGFQKNSIGNNTNMHHVMPPSYIWHGAPQWDKVNHGHGTFILSSKNIKMGTRHRPFWTWNWAYTKWVSFLFGEDKTSMRRGQHIWPTDCYMKANSLKLYLWIESDRTNLDFDLSHQRAADHVSGMHLLFLSGLPCAERHPTRLATPGTVELAVLIALAFHPGHWRTFILHLMDWSVGKIGLLARLPWTSKVIDPQPVLNQTLKIPLGSV